METGIAILLFILIILIAIIGYYSSLVNTGLTGSASSDANLIQATKISLWAEYTAVATLALAILGLILALVYSGSTVYLLLLLTILGLLILLAITADVTELILTSTSLASNPPITLQTAYQQSLLAAGLSLGTFIVTLIVLVLGLLYSSSTVTEELTQTQSELRTVREQEVLSQREAVVAKEQLLRVQSGQ